MTLPHREAISGHGRQHRLDIKVAVFDISKVGQHVSVSWFQIPSPLARNSLEDFTTNVL